MRHKGGAILGGGVALPLTSVMVERHPQPWEEKTRALVTKGISFNNKAGQQTSRQGSGQCGKADAFMALDLPPVSSD